jgi:hypothetical protein
MRSLRASARACRASSYAGLPRIFVDVRKFPLFAQPSKQRVPGRHVPLVAMRDLESAWRTQIGEPRFAELNATLRDLTGES